MCDEEQSNEAYGRQRVTLDAVKGPQLVETSSSKKDKDDDVDSSYDLFKQRQELQKAKTTPKNSTPKNKNGGSKKNRKKKGKQWVDQNNVITL